MKRKSVLLLAITIGILLLSVGCSSGKSNGSGQPEASLVPTISAVTAEVSSNDAQMEAMILEKLMGHHSIDIVLQAKHTREEWNATMDRMIARGAPISEQEKQQIIDWLISRNP